MGKESLIAWPQDDKHRGPSVLTPSISAKFSTPFHIPSLKNLCTLDPGVSRPTRSPQKNQVDSNSLQTVKPRLHDRNM